MRIRRPSRPLPGPLRPLQQEQGHVQNPERVHEVTALGDEGQEQDKRNLSGGRQGGKLSGGGVLVDEAQGRLTQGRGLDQSSSTAVNTDTLMNLAGGAVCLESCAQEDDNGAARHYVYARRGSRNSADGVTPIQSEEYKPAEVTIDSKAKIPDLNIPCDSNENAEHPSMDPEGSLQHRLNLQLMAAGRLVSWSSLTLQTSLPMSASNCREQVKAPFVQPPSKRTAKRKEDSLAGSSQTPAEKHEGMQTRRKAYQKTLEAVLRESAMEFQRLEQQKVNDGEAMPPREPRNFDLNLAPEPELPGDSDEVAIISQVLVTMKNDILQVKNLHDT